MEIRIDKNVFYAGVQKVQGIVEPKGAMPILAHLLITAEKDGINIKATDLEMGIQGFYPANVIKEGSVSLNARKLFDILRELPDQEIHLVQEENHWMTLKSGRSKFRLPGLSADEFPKFPEYSEDALMQFSGLHLKEMIRKTQFATSPDETRQALNALLLEKNNGVATIVGTDGHRLSLIHRPLLKSQDDASDPTSFLLPKKTLMEILKLVEEDDAEFSFSEKGNHLAFIHGREVVVSRKIEGKFPNYKQVVPQDNKLQVVINKEELLHALKRVAILADEKSKMVRFEISEDSLVLVSDATDQGAAREELTIAYQGEEISIGLNARYVLDILSVVDSEEVTLNLKDQNHSCLITVEKDKDYLGIVMPMRL